MHSVPVRWKSTQVLEEFYFESLRCRVEIPGSRRAPLCILGGLYKSQEVLSCSTGSYNIGAIIIGIGFGVHYTVVIIRNPQSSIVIYLSTYTNFAQQSTVSARESVKHMCRSDGFDCVRCFVATLLRMSQATGNIT